MPTNKSKSTKKTKSASSVKKPSVKQTKKTTSKKPAKKQAKSSTKKTKTTKSTKPTSKPKTIKKSTKKSAGKKTGTKKVAKGGAKGGTKTITSTTITRYFKVVIDEGDAHGRFSGTKPKQAANKALTSILKSREKKGTQTNGEIKFSIVECTRGSKHKQYNYVGERVELQNPMQVTIGKGDNAKVITYRYNNKVMKDKSA